MTSASDPLGDQLIFLISQPRSGSTLLQRLLSQHSAITSLAEPWFMLHLLYAMRPKGLAAEYNAEYAHRGLREFIAAVPEGRGAYLAAVRKAALTLYESALRSSGKRFFLDKTPRYYLVIPELMEAFPGATFLFLVRNPLDVMSSLLETHRGVDWSRLARGDRRHDLLTAPKAILEATSLTKVRQVLIRYENLVEHPARSIEEICRTIGVVFEPEMIEYEIVGPPGRYLGDSRGLHKHDRPVTEYVAAWQRRLDTRWKKEMALSYLRDLGPDTVNRLGFDYPALEKDLGRKGPGHGVGYHRWRVVSTPPNLRTWRDALRLATEHSRHERGWFRTVLRGLYICFTGRPPVPQRREGGDKT